MEDTNREGLHSIGEISKIVNISTDTLRYYDDINLLKPVMISKQTGYRYYSDNQATTILKIVELKQYGFSLNEIKQIISFGEEPLIEIYKNRYFELLQEKNKIQNVINKLSIKIKQNQEAEHMNNSILLVDDASFMRMMLRDIMQKQGYRVIGEAENGITAVEKYKNLDPDIVILDIVMPGMDGINALKVMKETNSGAKVIMCSAMSQPMMVIDSLLAGALDFIAKPFQPDTLINAVNLAFTEKRLYKTDVLEKLRNEFAGNTDILSQTEINNIIKSALTGEIYETEVNITKMSSNKNDERTEIKILQALEKLSQGQDEIKELLKRTLESK